MKPVQSFTTANTRRNPCLNTRTANSNIQEREEILPILEDVNFGDISTRILTSVAIPTSPRKKHSVPYAPPSASGQRSTPDSFIETPDALALEYVGDDVDDAQHSAWNGPASTSNLEPSLSIGAVASTLTPESLIEAYNTTKGVQKQGMRP